MADDVNLAMQYLQENKLRAAQKLLRRVLARDPNNLNAIHMLGITFLRSGKLVQAERIISKAVRAHPDLAFGHSNLGEVYRTQGKLEMAAASCRKALELDPGLAEAHANLGLVLEQTGELEEAVVSYRRALSISPDDTSTHESLAGALWRLGELEAAESSLREILIRKPRDPGLHNNLGLVLQDQDKLEDAIAAFQRAIGLAPGLSEAHSNLGVALRRVGRYAEALAAHEEALRLKQDVAKTHQDYAETLHEIGHTEQAITLLEQAVSLGFETAEDHCLLGDAYRSMGRWDEAIDSFRKGLAIEPEFATAYRLMVNCKNRAADNTDIQAMQWLYDRPDCLPEARVHLAFALGKTFEDLEDYETALTYFHAGNRLKREALDFSLSETQDFLRSCQGTFSPDLFASRTSAGSDSDRPIFVVGMPRSGTSLIEQILAGHPDVYAAGELRDLEAVIRAAFDRSGLSFPHGTAGLDDTTFADMSTSYLERLDVRPACDKSRIVDKMPQNFWFIGFIRLMMPNARVIHIRRDPMDTCFSIYANYFAGSHPYAYELTELGAYYRLYEAMMAHWREVVPDSMIEVDYESVVNEPEVQTRRLLDFCGLGFDRRCLDFQKTKRAVRTTSSWQVRQPLYRTSIARWRHYEEQLEPLRSALAAEKSGS